MLRDCLPVGLFLLAVVAAASLTDTDWVRYAEYPGHHQMIYGQRGDVDLAVMGSSRSMRVFQADSVSAAVEKSLGVKPVICDLSRAWRDLGHMEVFIRDLLATRKVRMLLVEFKETGVQNRHPYFERTATWQDIFASYHAQPSTPWFMRVHEQVLLSLQRVTNRLTMWLTGSLKPIAAPAAPTRLNDPSKPYLVKSELLAETQRKYAAKWTDEAPASVDLAAVEEERNLYYVQRIIELARQSGTEVMFYYIPRLYRMPLATEFVASFESRFGVRLIQPTLADLKTVMPDGYTDTTHMGVGGSLLYANLLARELPWK